VESKNIEIKLNVKNFKVGKILHTVLSEYVADFEREHPRVLPSLYRALKSNDAREAKKHIINLKKILTILTDQVIELDTAINDYMCSQIVEEEGKGVKFIDTDGNTSWSMRKGEEVELTEAPKKKPIKKKAPAKKRATKKKAKKEE
jgi:hypothetical protein